MKRAQLALLALLFAGCSSGGEAASARINIRTQLAAEVKAMVRSDIERHQAGIRELGERIGPGFSVEDPAERVTQMRSALRYLTRPPKGIAELVASARTFVAAVGPDGKVLATDARAEVDRMSGLDLAARFAVVRDALNGKAGYGIDQFPALEEGAEGNTSLLFAAPALAEGKVVGAALTGIPLWRLSQRVSKQMQLDHVAEKGVILWAYVFRGEQLFHFGTPPDLDSIIPDAAARAAGLSRSPGGFTGTLLQFGRWYGYGVLPIRALGAETGFVLVRSDP